jgi:hypothetical protein
VDEEKQEYDPYWDSYPVCTVGEMPMPLSSPLPKTPRMESADVRSSFNTASQSLPISLESDVLPIMPIAMQEKPEIKLTAAQQSLLDHTATTLASLSQLSQAMQIPHECLHDVICKQFPSLKPAHPPSNTA